MKYEKGKLGLIIPVRAEHPLGSINLQQIEDWRNQLQIGDFKESIRSCHEILQRLHGSKVAPETRLEMLNIIRPVVGYLCESALYLYKQHQYFNKKIIDLYRIILTLHLGLFNEYKLTLEDMDSSVSKVEDLVEIVRLALQQSCKIIFLSYETYREPPSHLWYETHLLFSIAQKKGINDHHMDIENKWQNRFKNITNLYNHIVLFALTNPMRYRRSDLLKIYYALEVWAPLVEFSEIQKSNGALFKIDLGKDVAPHYCALDTSQAIKPYYIMLDKVIEHIESLLHYQENAKHTPTPIFSSQELSLPKSILQILLHTWQNVSQRQFVRVHTSGSIMAAFGVPTIYKLASNELLSSDGKDIKTQDKKSNDAKYQDVEEINLDSLPLPENTISNLFDNDDSKVIECNIVDKSDGGFCLKYSGAELNKPQVGEVVGLLHNQSIGKFDLQLSVIRWVQVIDNNKQILIGLELLSLKTLPATLSTQNKDTSGTEGLLMEPLTPGNQLLLTPTSKYKHDEQIKISFDEKTYECQLKRDLNITSKYSVWEVSFLGESPAFPISAISTVNPKTLN